MFNKQEIPVPGGNREQIRRLQQAVKDALLKAEAAEAEAKAQKQMREYWENHYERVLLKLQEKDRKIADLRKNNDMLLRDMMLLQGPQAPQGVGGDADDVLFREGNPNLGGRRGAPLGDPFGQAPPPRHRPAPGFQQQYEEIMQRERELMMRQQQQVVERAALQGQAAGVRAAEARNQRVHWDVRANAWVNADGEQVQLQQYAQANGIVQDVVNDMAAQAERVVWNVINEHEDVQVLRLDPEPEQYDPAPPEDEDPGRADW